MDNAEQMNKKGGENDTDSPASKQKKRKSSPSNEDEDNPPSEKIIKLERESCSESTTSETDLLSKGKECGELKSETSRDDNVSSSPLKILRTDHSEENVKVKEKKPARKRLKYLLQAISDQMEFYFSDSNLSKDRYLKKFIDQSHDGYVDLSIFANFNKLKAFHKDGITLKILSKALERSKDLQLSEDKTKVKRITPFTEISTVETNNRTVYVEYLPNHATHAWLQTIFSPCGKVVYISLPKYQSTGHIKGFAFVEFKSSEEAEKACSMLNNPPPLKEGERPGKFPKGNKTLNRLQKIAPVPTNSEQNSNDENAAEDSQGESAKKRKKKKKGKKKGQGDTNLEGEEAPVVEKAEVEGMEGKKKKKKKKKRKRQSLSQDEGFVKEGDVTLKNEKEGSDSILEMEKQNQEKPIKMLEDNEANDSGDISMKKRKKKKKKRKGGKKQEIDQSQSVDKDKEGKNPNQHENVLKTIKIEVESDNEKTKSSIQDDDSSKQVLGRRERKRLRQEDIKLKKREREAQEKLSQGTSEKSESSEDQTKSSNVKIEEKNTSMDQSSTNNAIDSEVKADTGEDEASVVKKNECSEQLPSCLKSKRLSIQKKVEFNPVPVMQEFVREKEIRKRRKAKRNKLHLRVITKKEWLSLKAEYLNQQKSHMNALKESLRELRQQENQSRDSQVQQVSKYVDLEDVFGTKRLKLSQDVKMAHVESLKFTPNVIVQWKSSNEMHRDKIRTMFKDISGDSIAYIDAQEEAKSGYIRFKDEVSAEQFAKFSRHSNSFSARVLPVEQQQDYWDKANADRMKKLGRKKIEKGSQRIARKVFERNKVTFQEKPSRIVFTDETEENTSE